MLKQIDNGITFDYFRGINYKRKIMITRNQNAGIAAALLGLAGGLFAWWRYNNATPEEKARLKNKVNELGTKLKDTYTEVEDTVSDNVATLKNKLAKEQQKAADQAEKIAS